MAIINDKNKTKNRTQSKEINEEENNVKENKNIYPQSSFLSKTGTSNIKCLRVGLIAQGDQVENWWIPLIHNSPVFEFVAIWSKQKLFAENVIANISHNKNIEIFFEVNECTDAIDNKNLSCIKVNSKNNLESLIQRSDIDAFFVVLPPEIHGDVVMRILAEGNKHIYSVNMPTEDNIKMSSLVNAYVNCRNKATQDFINDKSSSSSPPFIPVWSLNETVRHETAFHRAKAMLSDIGQVVGGQLNATMLPEVTHFSHKSSISDVSGKSEIYLTAACCSYSALLRSFFGEMTSINTISTAVESTVNKDTLAGSIVFENDVSVSITLTYSTTLNNYFYFSIWGTHGHIQVSWVPQETAFEVHRYMHHYEHPTQHPSTGSRFSVQSWVHAVLEGKIDYNTPMQALIDLTMATAMIDSNGADIIVKG